MLVNTAEKSSTPYNNGNTTEKRMIAKRNIERLGRREEEGERDIIIQS